VTAGGFDRRAARSERLAVVALSHCGGTAQLVDLVRRTDLLHYTTTPLRTMQLIAYLHRIGFLKQKPERFEDFYWENMHGRGGS
jgi:hypothetical protein